MKEATSELNATVVVVMLVAILAVFFFSILWPGIRNTMNKNAKCSDAMCDPNSVDSNGFADCVYKDNKGEKYNLKCVWKG